MKPGILIITLLTFFGCNQIEDTTWKYRDGFHIGDWIEFNDSASFLRNDTIFLYELPIAKVERYEKGIFDQLMVIEQLNDTTKGYYISKERN